MANIKSSRKSARQAIVRRAHKNPIRTAVRSAIKRVKKASAAGETAAAAAALEKSRSVIDRVAAKGVLHRNAAARHKSRLAQSIKAMQ
jgi:small subunit ribosomal protein S20